MFVAATAHCLTVQRGVEFCQQSVTVDAIRVLYSDAGCFAVVAAGGAVSQFPILLDLACIAVLVFEWLTLVLHIRFIIEFQRLAHFVCTCVLPWFVGKSLCLVRL